LSPIFFSAGSCGVHYNGDLRSVQQFQLLLQASHADANIGVAYDNHDERNGKASEPSIGIGGEELEPGGFKPLER
jgi:hypothetical protein